VRAKFGESKSKAHSALSGLANYCFDGLLHPEAGGRRASLEWWKRAFDVAAAVGAKASGGPLGGMSVADAADPKRREQRYRDLLDAVAELTHAAKGSGLERLQVECTPLAREIPHTVERHFQSDSHWGWPDKRGLFDVANFGREVRTAGLHDVPALLEIIYPFELADDAVLKSITSSVMHCRREYAGDSLSEKRVV
jgi:hypothetical protein